MDAIAEESNKVEEEDRPGAETILLVENSDPLRALIKEFLRGKGYAVVEAANGKEAIRMSKAFVGPIHLLLTDVIMPGMGGKLAERLASLRPGTKTLFMSGYSNEAIMNSGLFRGEMVFPRKTIYARHDIAESAPVLDDVSPRV